MLRVSRPGEVAVVHAVNLRNEVIVIDDADSVVVVPWQIDDGMAELIKAGVRAGLNQADGSGQNAPVSGVDCPPADGFAVDGDEPVGSIGEADVDHAGGVGSAESGLVLERVKDSRVFIRRWVDDLKRFLTVKPDGDSELGNGHCSSFLRRVRRFVCVAASSLRRRGKGLSQQRKEAFHAVSEA